MAWLPGQTCVGSAVFVAELQSSPFLLTMAAHIRVPLNKPPILGEAPAATNFSINAEVLGRPLHAPLSSAFTIRLDPIPTSSNKHRAILFNMYPPKFCLGNSDSRLRQVV